MQLHQKRLLKSGLFCLPLFTLSLFVVNPFIPDVCTSTGYGYPFPVYIKWCECFIDKPPTSVQYIYIVIDLVVWFAGWIWLSGILSMRSISSTKLVSSEDNE